MYHTSPYHPQTTQRSHQTINNVSRAATLLKAHRLTWAEILTNMCLPVDCHLPCAVLKLPLTKKDCMLCLKVALAACQKMTQQNLSTPAAQAPSPYKPGYLILVSATPKEKAHKLAPRWQGLFEVVHIPHYAQVRYFKDGQHWVESRWNVKHYTPQLSDSPQLTKDLQNKLYPTEWGTSHIPRPIVPPHPLIPWLCLAP